MRNPKWWKKAFLPFSYLLIAASVVLVTFQPHWNILSNRYMPFFNYQADAFLHGRADISLPQGWGPHDTIVWNQKTYFALPPLNGILYVPFVALFGLEFPERLFTLLLLPFFLLILHQYLKRHVRLSTVYDEPLWVGFFILGTGLLTCTATATPWFAAALSSCLFLSLACLLHLESKTLLRSTWAVLFVCIAALGRYHLILIAPLFILHSWKSRFRKSWRALAILSLPVLGFLLLILVWNLIRFGDPFQLHYRQHAHAAFFSDVLANEGFTSLRFIFLHLYHGLVGIPKLTSSFPFFSYDESGNGILATSPLFLYLIFRPRKWDRSDQFSLLCIAAVASVVFTHFSTGWRQFGYRYALDVFPFLVYLLTRTGLRIASPLPLALIGISLWFQILGTLSFIGL